MARPINKEMLFEASSEQFLKLWNLIDSMTEEQKLGEICLEGKEAHWARDKNVRDILIHLYEWHQLLLKWVSSNMEDVSVPFLPAQYTWKTYGDMNVEFWTKHQDTSYENAVTTVKESHIKVMELAERFSSEELFAKGIFPWVGGSTLGSYFVSATSSHYDWAIKKIKKYVKSTAV